MFIRISIFLNPFGRDPIALKVSSLSRTSKFKTCTLVKRSKAFFIVIKRSKRLPQSIKWIPCFANSYAVASPIPLVAPVIRAVFFHVLYYYPVYNIT